MANTLKFRGGSTTDIASSTVSDREIVFDTDKNTLVLGSAKDYLMRYGGNSQSGNVGIGVASPSTALDVSGTVTATAFAGPITGNVTGNVTGNLAGNVTGNVTGNLAGNVTAGSGTAAAPSVSVGTSDNGLYSPGTDQVSISTNGIQAITVDSSQNVGIGTSGVRDKTHIYGDGQITANIADSGTRDCFLRLSQSGASSGTGGGVLFASQQGDNANSVGFAAIKGLLTDGQNNTTGDLAFSVRNATTATSLTERLRISSDGRTDTFATSETLRVRTAATTAAASIAIRLQAGATAMTAGGTTEFQVTSNGNVANTNNAYGAISDIKLKENIVDANSQWSDIKALQVRNYNFKEGQTHTQIGLVAQEVELVSPGLVSESPDRDEDGDDLGTVTKSVNYSVLYMKAVKALQEAMDRIETLEAKVAALENS